MKQKQRDFIKHVGKLIREQRVKLGLSQEELAWKCDLSQTSLCFIELAKGDIKFSNIITIFEELNLDFNQLDYIKHEVKNNPK